MLSLLTKQVHVIDEMFTSLFDFKGIDKHHHLFIYEQHEWTMLAAYRAAAHEMVSYFFYVWRPSRTLINLSDLGCDSENNCHEECRSSTVFTSRHHTMWGKSSLWLLPDKFIQILFFVILKADYGSVRPAWCSCCFEVFELKQTNKKTSATHEKSEHLDWRSSKRTESFFYCTYIIDKTFLINCYTEAFFFSSVLFH